MGRTGGGPRQTRLSHVERRAQIVECARRLFSTHPVASVSMEAVAREAGVTSALLYHYFDGKHKLYVAVVREMFRVTPPVPEYVAGVTPEERLEESIDRWLDMVAALLLRGTSHYTIHAEFQDAGQLVKGDRVSVGGITIGSVKAIGLGDRSQAVVTMDITDKAFKPLHTGTTATIRSPSLSTQASRYISLAPGPNSNPKLADGGTIGAEDTAGIVDLDELLNTPNYQAPSNLQGIVHGMATQFAGRGAA